MRRWNALSMSRGSAMVYPPAHLNRSCRLLNDLIRPPQQRLRDRQAKRFGRLEVDDQLEVRWLLDGEVGGLRALQNSVHKQSGPPPELRFVRPIAHESSGLVGPVEHARDSVLGDEVNYLRSVLNRQAIHDEEERVGTLSSHRGEGPLEVPRASHFLGLKG